MHCNRQDKYLHLSTDGPRKSLVLPMLHVLTGCDTASSFAGKSKKCAWDTWSVFPEVSSLFLEIVDVLLMTVQGTFKELWY